MNIVIAPFAAPFVSLFVNLAKHLEHFSHQVTFAEADPYISHLLRQEGISSVSYPKAEAVENFYTANSNIVKQYCRLHRLKNVQKVVKQKNEAYTRAKAFFQGAQAQKVIIFNGEMNVESDVCKTLGIKTFFCENGYFPEMFQMNRMGVNAKAEYAQLSSAEFMQMHFPKANLPQAHLPIIDIEQSLIMRYALRFFSSDYRRIVWQALQGNKAKNRAMTNFKQAPVDSFNPEQLEMWAFFPLQVNSDTQMVLNSPYESMYEVLRCTLPKLIRAGYQVVLKEHPDEVEPVDYSEFVDNKQVFLLKKFDINRLISESDFTITVNSSVGLQAVSTAKPVILLGESFYQSAPNVQLLAKDSTKLQLPSTYSATDVENYIAHFKKEIFIAGNWRKPTSEFLQSLCCRILA
ncbi:MAG: hypothetical protein ACK5JS_05400 [Mangrovibacterium sp.]